MVTELIDKIETAAATIAESCKELDIYLKELERGDIMSTETLGDAIYEVKGKGKFREKIEKEIEFRTKRNAILDKLTSEERKILGVGAERVRLY